MSVKELRIIAKEYDIKGYYKMKKEQLKNEISKYEKNKEEKRITEQEEQKTLLIEDRNYSFRQQLNLNIDSLEEPFSFIQEYGLKATPIPGDEIFRDCFYENFTDFPKCIDHYFWIQEGQHDGETWKCLVKIDDGVTGGTYAYFEAGCDYTGFDCQGWMKVWVSHYYSTLIKFAMNEATYQQYLRDTQSVEVTSCGNCELYGFPCANCT